MFLGSEQSLMLTVVKLSLVYFSLHRIWLWYRLCHVPGPSLASFSKFWLLWRSAKGELHIDLKEACDTFGPLIRIGPNDVITDDFETIRKINNPQSKYARSDWYSCGRLEPPHDNIVTERNEARHNALRTKMAPGYGGKENPHLEDTINDRVLDLVNLLERQYLSTDLEYRPVDFSRVVQYFALDVIGDIAFGAPFGYLKHNQDLYKYLETTARAVPLITLVGNLPVISRILGSHIFRKFLLPSAKDKLWLGKMIGIARKTVSERFGPSKKVREDMLGSFVRHGLTNEEAVSESLFQIVAGSDTTATAIRTVVMFVISSTGVYNTLMAEIDRAEHQGNISSPVIRDAEAKKLPYLQACIKESLRLVPPVTGISLKEVPLGGDVIHGYSVPSGTRVGLAQWAMQRKKNVFGADADVFRPERWLDANVSSERHLMMKKSTDLIFATGRYACLGRSVAFTELNKVLVELFRRFEFSFVDPTRPWKCKNAIIWLIEEMNLRVTARLRDSTTQTQQPVTKPLDKICSTQFTPPPSYARGPGSPQKERIEYFAISQTLDEKGLLTREPRPAIQRADPFVTKENKTLITVHEVVASPL